MLVDLAVCAEVLVEVAWPRIHQDLPVIHSTLTAFHEEGTAYQTYQKFLKRVYYLQNVPFYILNDDCVGTNRKGTLSLSSAAALAHSSSYIAFNKGTL